MRRVLQYIQLSLLPCAVIAADNYISPGLTPADLQARLGTTIAPRVVDIRGPIEFGIGHIPGAINIPLDELEERIEEFRHKNGILVYCINGSRTRQAEPLLYSNGIENVFHLQGALQGWIRDGHPIEKGGVKKTGW